MRFLLMLGMLVFMGAMVSRGVLMVMSPFPCVVGMFVRMLMTVRMLVLMFVPVFVRFSTVLVLMLVFVLMFVFVLMLVRMLAFHSVLLSQ